eukprot:TRINITY_DN3278_c0_g3_i1.p1 TRINITY_DN3278_c0_g3~~TRINITY_DN3278_c0_g3_i1.p1  ORF type:complete len:297 (+),score=51.73 TRINITY_DN3278_c0_g3_i1:112-1002(+)
MSLELEQFRFQPKEKRNLRPRKEKNLSETKPRKRGREEAVESIKFEPKAKRKVIEDDKSAVKSMKPEVNECLPYFVSKESKYRDRFASACDDCFESHETCPHFAEKRLKLLICGHNPSEESWRTGIMYAHKSNRMWKILTGNIKGHEFPSMLPDDFPISRQNDLPDKFQIGFVDVCVEMGTDSSKVALDSCKQNFYARLRGHVQRVHEETGLKKEDCGPKIMCFMGVKQWNSLFFKKRGKAVYGKQSEADFPPGFPFIGTSTEVWLLPSTSGRVGVSNIDRVRQMKALMKACNKEE